MEEKNFKLSFFGNGMELFKIQIVNFILNVITLGLFYPWAKARKLQYIYSNTAFENHPFSFTGNGKEMFKGFIRALLFFVAAYGIFLFLVYLRMEVWAILFFYAFLFLIIPLAIHGSYRYRKAKTVWKGIRLGYVGDRTELMKLFLKGIFLTIITFGIYGAWFSMNLRKYVVENIRIGDANFIYRGNGGDFFLLNLKGYFLTIITLGIYLFWWQKDLFEYYINNLELNREDKRVFLKSKATGGGFFSLLVGNLLIIIFTLGLAFPLTVVRTLKFGADNIMLYGDFDFDSLQQTQNDYSNATGDDMTDILDFGFVI
jgi:uncharacterized membrane protein YjgN (DUF898 family)